MRLATIKHYRRTFFAPGSEPAISTVRSQAKDGTLPGVFQGNRWYIDLDELDRRHGLTSKLEKQRQELIESEELEGLT